MKLHCGLMLVATAIFGCDPSPAESEGGGAPPASSVTYYRDVAPILDRSCVGCHRAGEIGGFALDTFETAHASASLAAAYVEGGLMPPFFAVETDECDPPGHWADDPRLPADQIATLRAWADADAPAGDPADAVDVEPIEPPKLDRVDLEMERITPSLISGEGDQFHCVTFDPMVTEPTWISGIHLNVDNPEIAHHAITSIVKRSAAGAANGEYEECFGGNGGVMVHAWVPGGKPFDLPPEIGILVGPDDVFVVQMHYHPKIDSEETDASSLQLRFAESDPSYQLLVQLRGNAKNAAQGLLPGEGDDGAPEFFIPAEVEGHVEEMTSNVQTAGLELPLFFVAGHMHLVGRDIKVTLERDGVDQCLLQIPSWDFSWQLFYQYDAPISELPTVKQGDKLDIRCTYDNTKKNVHLAEGLEREGIPAPVDVSMGEETLDEMCIAALGVLVPLP
jgi:hypothetical protein